MQINKKKNRKQGKKIEYGMQIQSILFMNVI